MNALRLCAAALLAFVAGAAPVDEPTVSVKVRAGNIVEVATTTEDGKPCVGHALKLIDADKKLVAEGHSNSEGRWEWFLPTRGVYKVLVGPTELPVRVDIRDSVATTDKLPCCMTNAWDKPATTTGDYRFLWLPVGLAVCLLGSSGLVYAVRRAGSLNNGQVAFVAVLLAVGVGSLAWAGVKYLKPAAPPTPTAPNLADQVREYLSSREIRPLSGKLDSLLQETGANRDKFYRRSQDHPLLDEAAPDFTLNDSQGNPWSLQKRLPKGPVVVIFYYGYYCNHCVSQLFDVNRDIAYFRELGAEVIAISADPAATTLARFKEFGAFDYPVLSDPGNAVAERFGAFTPPEKGAKEGTLVHATFVIDREGKMQWAYRGEEPFSGNRALLFKLAELEERLPAGK